MDNKWNNTFIIAEAGVNHNGSVERALKMIDQAVMAGADAVKFQTFRSESVISRFAVKAEYQRKNTGTNESQLEMVKKLELDEEAHKVLVEHCRIRGIMFMSTPFDHESLKLLTDICMVSHLKVPSGEITNAPLLLSMAKTKLPIIMSTGMATEDEIEDALGVLAFGYLDPEVTPTISEFKRMYHSEAGKRVLTDQVSLLHCTTEYPAPYQDVNLLAMDTMRERFKLPVGLSDHTEGIAVAVAAVARGAKLIEKHFTLDRSLPGPDHKASLEPAELKQMIDSIRVVEQALGTGVKIPAESELKNKRIARKSLVASRSIAAGERFTPDNLSCKRPGDGISPMHYWEWLDKKAGRDYTEDEAIDWA